MNNSITRLSRFLKRNFQAVSLLGWGHFFLGFAVRFAYVLGMKRCSKALFARYSDQVKAYVERTLHGLIIEMQREGLQILPESGQKIWVCWLQGLEKAPDIVKKCVDSLRRHSNGRQVVVVTLENYKQYVSFPDYIEEKFSKGIITYTHFSDLLRAALLYQQGGLWVDATILCIKDIPDCWFESDFYSIKKQDEGLNVSESLWCCYFMSGKRGNMLHKFLFKGFMEYLKYESIWLDYLLLDNIVRVGYDCIPSIKECVDKVPYNNKYVEFFLRYGEREMLPNRYKAIVSDTSFFKLTYKKQMGMKPGSYSAHLLSELQKSVDK